MHKTLQSDKANKKGKKEVDRKQGSRPTQTSNMSNIYYDVAEMAQWTLIKAPQHVLLAGCEP